MASLHDVVRWADQNGDERVLERIRIFSLSHLLKEGIRLEQVTPSTTCSPECLAAVVKAAEAVVGKPSPYGSEG